jgi:hypothetical protein
MLEGCLVKDRIIGYLVKKNSCILIKARVYTCVIEYNIMTIKTFAI